MSKEESEDIEKSGSLRFIEIMWEKIPKLLQLDRLERLAMKNSVIAMNYAELIMKINWILLTWDREIRLKKGVGENIWEWLFGYQDEFVFAGSDPIEKLSALGFAFAHQSGKIEESLNVDNFDQFAVGMDKLLDFVGDAVSASRVAQGVYPGVPPGYQIDPSYRLKKLKGGSTPQLSSREISETNPVRPPKKWFNKMVKHVAKTSVRNPEAVVGNIWYNDLNDSKRREILKEYE